MIKAITAFFLGIIILALVWWLPYSLFATFLILLMAWGLYEYASMTKCGYFIMLFCGLLSGIALIVLPAYYALLIIVLVLFLMFMKSMSECEEMSKVFQMLSFRWIGISYLCFTLPFWVLVRGLENGRELVLLGIIPACLTDTFAFLMGKAFGRRKFASSISPNKTWEGFVGALIGSIIGVFIVKTLFLEWLPIHYAALLAVLIWIIAPLGDLCESFIKRSVGVKDSGKVIPGHGGILDRLDALIFIGPLIYAFARLLLR